MAAHLYLRNEARLLRLVRIVVGQLLEIGALIIVLHQLHVFYKAEVLRRPVHHVPYCLQQNILVGGRIIFNSAYQVGRIGKQVALP